MNQETKLDELSDAIEKDTTLNEQDKTQVLTRIQALKNQKVNILITGATGAGKSSTINALFNAEKAKIGTGTDPETMDIKKFELNNLVLFDTPGLGDGKEADIRHSKNIIDKLTEKDSEGNFLIDLVLVILEGSSRDLGTSFELINNVIIPNLGEDKSRLLIAINQADVAMKGRYWNHEKNEPEPKLVEFLNEKVESTRRRIKEATGVDTTPIYYSADYKEDGEEQKPYNLSKLLLLIIRKTKKEKRIVIANDINQDKTMWEKDDRLEDYQTEIKESMMESIVNNAKAGAEIGGAILGTPGRVIGGAVGAVVGFFKRFF